MSDRRPLHGQCGECKYVWAVVYLPMDATKAAEAMLRATCPMCGGREVFVASNADVAEAASNAG